MIRKLVLILAVLILCCGGSAVMYAPEYQDDDMLIKIAVYPSGTIGESYLISLSPEGELIASVGNRKSINFYDDFRFSYIGNTKRVCLTQDQVLEIIELANNITPMDLSEDREHNIYFDTWYVDVVYMNVVYPYIYGNRAQFSPHMRELISRLIDYSPIIIDTHGWS